MIMRAYNWLKNDIEQTKMSITITEILAFILLWVQMCLVYLTQPINEIYLYFMESNPIIITLLSILFIAIAFGLFVVSSFGMAKIVHKIRMKITHEQTS